MKSTSTSASRIAGSWVASDAWMLLALIVASVWAFAGPWRELLLEITRRTDNGYILIVPFVAAYLAWIRRSRLRYIKRRNSFGGMIFIAVAAAFAAFGAETDTRLATHLSAIISVVACVVTLTGFTVFRQFAPVFLSLLFLVPVPGEVRRMLAGPLQQLAVVVTHDILDLGGVAVEREGLVLIIEGKRIFVADACDGMRMVFALALTFFAFVFSVPLRPQARIFLLLASPFVALACNLLRLVSTGIAYAVLPSDGALEFHDVAGWLMLPLAIILLQLLLRFMRWLDLPVYTWRFLQA